MVSYSIYKCTQFLTEICGDLGSHVNRQDFKANATRKYFITQQDCCNIGRKLNEFKMHWHTDDAISMDHLVHKLQHKSLSCVIPYSGKV